MNRRSFAAMMVIAMAAAGCFEPKGVGPKLDARLLEKIKSDLKLDIKPSQNVEYEEATFPSSRKYYWMGTFAMGDREPLRAFIWRATDITMELPKRAGAVYSLASLRTSTRSYTLLRMHDRGRWWLEVSLVENPPP